METNQPISWSNIINAAFIVPSYIDEEYLEEIFLNSTFNDMLSELEESIQFFDDKGDILPVEFVHIPLSRRTKGVFFAKTPLVSPVNGVDSVHYRFFIALSCPTRTDYHILFSEDLLTKIASLIESFFSLNLNISHSFEVTVWVKPTVPMICSKPKGKRLS